MSSSYRRQDKKHNRDLKFSRNTSGSHQTQDSASYKGKGRSSHESEDEPTDLYTGAAASTQYLQAPADPPNQYPYSYAAAAEIPDIGNLSLGQQQYPLPAATAKAQTSPSDVHIFCIVQCTRGYAILTPEPRPQPVAPRRGDTKSYAAYQNDLKIWEAEYETWKHVSCACHNAYYCKAHGQWVSGALVRARTAPSQRKETPETCHKRGYFCDAHGQWVSDEDIERRRSASQRKQNGDACHRDGYFCEAHRRWVPGEMIRLSVAAPEDKQTSETCHIFAKEKNIVSYVAPPDESCKAGNGKVAEQTTRAQTYPVQPSSPQGYVTGQGLSSAYLTSPAYSSRQGSNAAYSGSTQAGIVTSSEQSSYGPASTSQYQGYSSIPIAQGYTGYSTTQYPASTLMSTSSARGDSSSTAALGYNTAYSAQVYYPAMTPAISSYPTASGSQVTGSYQTETNVTGESDIIESHSAQDLNISSPNYGASYSSATPQSTAEYPATGHSSTSSYPNILEYTQPQARDQFASTHYETSYQGDSPKQSRNQKSDQGKASKQDKRRK